MTLEKFTDLLWTEAKKRAVFASSSGENIVIDRGGVMGAMRALLPVLAGTFVEPAAEFVWQLLTAGRPLGKGVSIVVSASGFRRLIKENGLEIDTILAGQAEPCPPIDF